MALTSSYVSDFTAGMPSFLSNFNSGGSNNVTGGVLNLVTGDASNEYGGVQTPGGDTFDSTYIRMTVPSPSYSGQLYAVDAGFDGYRMSVSDIAGTPTLRWTSMAAGVPTTIADTAYSATDHKWLRLRLTGGTFYFEVAPDSGDGPGSWTVMHSETKAAAFGDTAAQVIAGSFYNTTTGATVVVDGWNTTTVAAAAYVRPTIIAGMSQSVHRAAHY